MDFPSHLASAAAGAIAGATLSESVDPLFKAVGGGAGCGTALMCAWEMRRDEPDWERAAGRGAAFGGIAGGLLLLHDIISNW
jgi:hypothetical protein